MLDEQYSWNLENKAMVFTRAGWHRLLRLFNRTASTIESSDPESSRAATRSMVLRTARQVVGYALRLRGIRVHSHMGVSESERARAQELVVAVDVELGGELYPSSDELDRAADYAEIVEVILGKACA